jgi:Holliday junction resolvase RusA-like endonuclease
MPYISVRISGTPYPKDKQRGNKTAAKTWIKSVIEHTKNLGKIRSACALKITFLLPLDKFPRDLPYGPDIDNLVKALLDGLNDTVFSEVPGRDSCVSVLTAMKTKVGNDEEAGAHLEILTLDAQVS